MDLWIFTPTDYYGAVMELINRRSGIFIEQDYPAPNRVQLKFEIPLSEIIIDFFDELKSKTKGYASMDYQLKEYRAGSLVKLEVLIGGDPVDALASIVHKEQAYMKGQKLVSKLKEIDPPAAVRGFNPSSFRGKDNFTRECESGQKRCIGEMLWRRCKPEKETA